MAILSEPATADLRSHGKLVAGSETVIAKVGIGAFVRKGDPKPDISSVDAFLRAVSSARVIAYADPSLTQTLRSAAPPASWWASS